MVYVHFTTVDTGFIGLTVFERMSSFQTLKTAPFDSIFSFNDRRILVAFIAQMVLLTVTTLIDTGLTTTFLQMGT